MFLLVVGLIVGALAAAVLVSGSSRHRLRTLRRQNSLLRSRLHSLLVLAEYAIRQVDDPDVQMLLQETRAQLIADHLVSAGDAQTPATGAVSDSDEHPDEDIPAIFPRHPS